MTIESADEKLEAIQLFPYFYEVSNEILEPLVRFFEVDRYERGDYLWRQGTHAEKFTFIVEGRIKIAKWTSDDEQVVLGLFGEGDPIGHVAVFNEMKYPAEAIAVEDTAVLQIRRKHFLGTLREEPELMEAILRNMMDRNFKLVRRLHDLSVSSAEKRLALLFHKLAYNCGIRRPREDGLVIEIPVSLSRSDLAQMINTRVETAIRKMSKWRDEGLIETKSDGFIIHDLDRIEELAEPADDDF
ncbi:MAG: Crp/Fnr family transcriptional regulator [Bradymonadaceae bacterium]